ncbi:MAG: hypothetical protein LBT53_01095 [Puniceicoccales bacterium]|jgi:hypothetical protein|nr:hypothetical protein [Puniceicoccales bacterium]
MSTTLQAEVFRSGDDLLVRLPHGVKLRPKTYQFEQTNNGFELIDPALVAKRERMLAKLFRGQCEVPEELIR